MSTKTLRKRIALAAVSALGAGMLSLVVVPSASAADEISIAASSDVLGQVVAKTGSTTSQTMTITSTGSVKVTVAAGTLGVAAGTGSRVTVSGGVITSVGTITTAPAADLKSLIYGSTAGNITVAPTTGSTAIVVKTFSSAANQTSDTYAAKLTINVVAASTIGVFSASNSYAKLNTSAGGSANTYTDVANANLRANGLEGFIDYTVADGNTNAMPTTSVITATATNGAKVAFSTGGQLGSTVSQALTSSSGTIYVAQPAANTPVSTVVTISVDGVVWTSKSLTIVGDIASVKLTDATVGALSSTGTFNAAAYDAAGNLVQATLTSDGSLYNASVTGASTVSASHPVSDVTAGTFNCSATPGAGKLSYYVTNAALAKITSNTLDVSCAGNPYTWTASLDKSTYKPGEIATLSIVAKDSKGNLVNGAATLGTKTTYELAIAGGQLTAVTAPSTGDTFSTSAGTKKYKFTVGTTEGSYALIVDMPKWQGGANSSSSAQTSQTVSYTVSAGAASVTNAQVLAAIVKLIASINKQIAALQKSLKK